MFITLCVCFFLFGFEGGMRDLTVFVSGYCLSIYPKNVNPDLMN